MLLQVGAELLEDGAVDRRVRTSLRLVQTTLPTVTPDTVKPLGLVEVEVGGYYPWGRLRKRSTL